MTVLCAHCGETLTDDEHRCPACDALAPPPAVDDTLYSRSVFDEPAPVDATRVEAVVPDPRDDDAAPWAIPIREGRAAAAPRRDPLRPVLVGVIAIAVLAGLVVLGAQVLGGDGDAEAAAVPESESEVAGDDIVADETTTTTFAVPAPTPTSVPSTSSSTTTPTTTTSTTAPAPTTSTTVAATSSGSAPRLSSSFSGGWVAQLASVPGSTTSDQVDTAWSQSHRDAAGAVVARSDGWSPLSPGFWIVLDPGPFRSADDVRAFCDRIGRADRSDCLPRELSSRG